MESQSLRDILRHDPLSRASVNHIWGRQANSQQIYEPGCLLLREERGTDRRSRRRAGRWRNHAFIFGTGNLAVTLWMELVKERGLLRPAGKYMSSRARRYRLDPAKSTGIKRRWALKERETRGPIYSAAFQIRLRDDYLLARIFHSIATDVLCFLLRKIMHDFM